MKYADISSATGIDINTLKQFVHRKSSAPRKTPIFYKLLQFARSIDGVQLERLCQNEAAIEPIVRSWRNTPQTSSGTPLNQEDVQKSLADALLRHAPLPEMLGHDYYLFRPASQQPVLIKSRLRLRNSAYGIQFDHTRRVGQSDVRTTQGLVVVSNVNIFFVGTSSNILEQEMMLFRRPQQIPRTARAVAFASDRIQEVPFLLGIFVGNDPQSNPLATRVLLIPSSYISSDDLGNYSIDQLKAQEYNRTPTESGKPKHTTMIQRIWENAESKLKSRITPLDMEGFITPDKSDTGSVSFKDTTTMGSR
jgi:hypothetical protein